jgi:hypothetical protein
MFDAAADGGHGVRGLGLDLVGKQTVAPVHQAESNLTADLLFQRQAD